MVAAPAPAPAPALAEPPPVAAMSGGVGTAALEPAAATTGGGPARGPGSGGSSNGGRRGSRDRRRCRVGRRNGWAGGRLCDWCADDATSLRQSGASPSRRADTVSRGTEAKRGAPSMASRRSPREWRPARTTGAQTARLGAGSAMAWRLKKRRSQRVAMVTGASWHVPTACAAAMLARRDSPKSTRVEESRVEVMTDRPVPQSPRAPWERACRWSVFQSMGCGSKRRNACLASRAVRKARTHGAPAPPHRRRSALMSRPGCRVGVVPAGGRRLRAM